MSRQAHWLLWWWLLLLAPMAQAGTKYYYYTDAQGTPLAKADAQGAIVERYDYTPYGVPVQGNGPDGPGYTGHVNDPETGLVYMQQRYYDPAGGRFLSVDPVMALENPMGAFNRYWYANNNPYRYTDPDGRCSDADDSCGRMVKGYGEWANANPQRADELGSKIGLPGIAMMAVATAGGVGGVSSATTLIGTMVRLIVRSVARSGEAKRVEETVVRRTRAGEKAIRVTREDGSIIDISPRRVKEFVPNTHPKAPSGALQKVKFEDAQPGSKGLKRNPTPEELKRLKETK